MKEIGKLGLRLSAVAEQKFKEGEFLLSARLYRMATEMVCHDTELKKELAKRIEEDE